MAEHCVNQSFAFKNVCVSFLITLLNLSNFQVFMMAMFLWKYVVRVALRINDLYCRLLLSMGILHIEELILTSVLDALGNMLSVTDSNNSNTGQGSTSVNAAHCQLYGSSISWDWESV